ncbi:MAG: alpha/beta hydrolase, partial [Acidobacteriota bacterium]
PDLARRVTAGGAALPSPFAELAAAAAYVHGLDDQTPDVPAAGPPEALAAVRMVRAAAALERGLDDDAAAELTQAVDAVRTRSPVFAAQLAAQRAELLRAEPQQAVLALKDALQLAEASKLPGQRSGLYVQLGLLLHDLAEGRRGLLLEAVKAYQEALQEGLANYPRSETFALVQNHLGLAYLRDYGDAVERAVLTKVEGPDHTFKLPSTVQRHLEHVHRLAAEDPTAARATPDVLGAVEGLLTRLQAEPQVVEVDGEEVAIGALDLEIALSRALASSQTIAEIPAELRRLEDGDWRRLAEATLDHRRVGIFAMALMMDCASGASPERRRQLRAEAEDPRFLLGDAILAPFYPEACAGAGRPDLGDAFRGPLEVKAPVLFISGTLDVRTPPGNVEELLPGFPNARHLVIENAGHESRELMSPELRDLLQAFLRGESVDSMTITLPEPIFRSVEDLDAEDEEDEEDEG